MTASKCVSTNRTQDEKEVSKRKSWTEKIPAKFQIIKKLESTIKIETE